MVSLRAMDKTYFYVASKAGEDNSHVEQAVGALENIGLTPSFDWTQVDVKKPYRDNHETNRLIAQQMAHAVGRSEYVIFLDAPNVFGGLLELGMAISESSQSLVWVVNPSRESIFWCLPYVRVVDSFDEVLTEITELEEQF